MKFHTLALVAALLAPKVNSQPTVNVTNGNFTFVGSYDAQSVLGDGYLGGGSIVGDTLLLVVNAESRSSYIASVPVQRDSTTGRITGFDFANADKDVFVEEYLDMLSQMASFAGDKFVYTNSDSGYEPYSMSFADRTFTNITKIEDIPSLGITDNSGALFHGPYGVDFSPVITDPGTNVGKLMCTSIYSFWEVGLQLDSSTNKWEITDATKLADLDAEYGGGFSFIPSGSNKNNIFFSDWDNNIVKMLKFGTDGRPLVPTETTDFITGIEGPWGFFFDPQTKDFFVSTWYASSDGIVQFKGFPPGLDVDVVIANIQNEMKLALEILLSGRRKLKADQHKSLRSSNRNLQKTGDNPKAANPCDKANPNADKGLQTAGKNCDGAKEVEIPSSDDIANELLSSETTDEATEYFTGLLKDTFSNDSFETGVLSGGDSQVFGANIAKVTDSVDLVLQEAATANINEADKAIVEGSLAKVKQLLALLAGVVEG